MDTLQLEQIARIALASFGIFGATLALTAWRMPWGARAWGAALAVSTSAYALCTMGEPVLALSTGRFLLVFLCSALPAFFWGFVHVLFNDAPRLSWLAFGIVLLVGLLGVLAAVLADSAPVAQLLSALRRVFAIGLVVHALWALARGGADDLILERLRTRHWLLGIAGIYVLMVLIVEVWLTDLSVTSALQATNLFAISLLCLGVCVALTRWDIPVVAMPPELGLAPIELQQREPGNRPEAKANDDYTELIARLRQAMVDEQLFRTEGLTIARLADHLGTQQHRLRRGINQHLGYKNYNDFLHDYRLTEASQRLRDRAQLSIPVLTIALEVGYGSIGPFNRAFRGRFGCTPTEYRRNHESG